MTRLTKDMRYAIANKAVEVAGVYRLREALVPKRAKLANDIRVYSLGGPAKAKKVDAFAAEFPGLVNTGYREVAVVNGKRHTIHFSGEQNVWRLDQANIKPVYLPQTDDDVVLDEGHRLAMRLRSLLQKEEEIKEREDSVRRGALAMASSVTTVKKLLGVWPEAAELLPKAVEPEKQLPAVPVRELNTLIGLPTDA